MLIWEIELVSLQCPYFCINPPPPILLFQNMKHEPIYSSAVFQLPEGKLLSYLGIVPSDHILDVPNAVLGFLFYSCIFLLEHFLSHKTIDIKRIMLLAKNCLAMASSLFLALALWRLRELCLLCITTHLINMALLVHHYKVWIVHKRILKTIFQ